MAPAHKPSVRFVDGTLRVESLAPCAIDRALRHAHPGSSWNDVRRLVRTGKVSVDSAVVLDPSSVVRPGAAISIRMTSPRPAGSARVTRDIIVYVDPHLVVVRKPPGLATVPYEDERDTLDRQVQSLLRKVARHGTSVAPLGVVQRLDKDTSGLIVFARTTAAKRELSRQLRQHAVHRRYLGIAHGFVQSRTLRSRLVSDRGDGLRGSTESRELARR